MRFGSDLELLDSPGIIPMRISDQSAAIKLAICNDIGERSYDVIAVASILIQMLSKIPTAGFLLHPLKEKYLPIPNLMFLFFVNIYCLFCASSFIKSLGGDFL